VVDPDPREALVPLFTIASDPHMRDAFARAAERSRGARSHFAIPPTVLTLLGYGPEIAEGQGSSLFQDAGEPSAFTSGDVFGLFSTTARWHPMDLRERYLEPTAGIGSSVGLRPRLD
jgi:hypothetical protein